MAGAGPGTNDDGFLLLEASRHSNTLMGNIIFYFKHNDKHISYSLPTLHT